MVIFSSLPRFPYPPTSSDPSMPSSKTPHGLVTKVREPALAELPLFADAMVAAGVPHGAGLVDVARIEDTSSALLLHLESIQ